MRKFPPRGRTISRRLTSRPRARDAEEHQLPLPGAVAPDGFVAFERNVFEFLQNGEYKQPGWCRDEEVRDTGVFLNKVYYGSHPAVRIFYSPMMMRWLAGGRTAVPGARRHAIIFCKDTSFRRPVILFNGKVSFCNLD